MLHEEVARFSKLSGEDAHSTSISRIGGYLDGYDKGREDERRDWKLAAGEMVMKYAGDIYDALPEAVKEIYEQGRKDGITEANLAHNIECGDCVRQITAADEARIRADERANVLDEIVEAFNELHFDSPMMNPIMTRNEILLFLKELKEDDKNEN